MTEPTTAPLVSGEEAAPAGGECDTLVAPEGQPEIPLQCSGSEAGPKDGHSADFGGEHDSVERPEPTPAGEAQLEATAEGIAPTMVSEPPYADFVAEGLESCKSFGKAFGGSDIGRCHKVEARALKALLPALQQRLKRI